MSDAQEREHGGESWREGADPVEQVKAALSKLDVGGAADSVGKAVKSLARQLGISKPQASPYIVYDRAANGRSAGKTLAGALLALVAVGFAGATLVSLPFAAVGLWPFTLGALAGAVGFGTWSALRVRAGRREQELAGLLSRMSGSLEERERVSLAELAQLAGVPVSRLESLLRLAIERGYLPEGHLRGTSGRRTLFLTDRAWESELQTMSVPRARRPAGADDGEGSDPLVVEAEVTDAAQDEARARVDELPEDAAEVVTTCVLFAQDALKTRAEITDGQVGASLEGMAAKVEKLAAYVCEHPETAPQLRKLVTYYLPTTAKLAASYGKLESRGGEQAESTRAELKETLALVDSALEKLSDDLLREESWDLKADMDVMRAMIEQDGLAR